MTRNGMFILAGVTALGLGLAAAGAVAHRGDWGHHGWGGRHYGGSMGFMNFGGFGGPMGRLCRGDTGEMADHMLVRIDHKVKPTEVQKGAFEELKAAAKSAAEKIKAGCPKDLADDTAKGGERPLLSPVERLARAQTQLEASLDAVKTVRPAAEKFYASLTDEQKTKLTERSGRSWKHGDRRHEGEDRPGTDSGTPPAQHE
jgi:histone H3/H4